MKKLPLTSATDDQIREFAEVYQQIDVSGSRTRAELLAALLSGWEPDYIFVEEAEHGAQTATVAAQALASFDTGRDDGPPTMFKVLQTDMPGGKHPAAPDVNGKKLVIQRGMLVTAPYAFYLALKNASVAIPSQAAATPGMPSPDVTFTEVTNYPMSDVTLPPQADIDAWHARNGSRLLGGEAPVRLAA